MPLDQQDRSRWDADADSTRLPVPRPLVADGAVRYASRFHLEAAIAARHCSAPSFAETDWVSICHLYDRLIEIAASPMVVLNRAVAVSYRDGPEAAIPLVEAV